MSAFRRLGDGVVLATSTMTLPIVGIASAIRKGKRVIIAHWFNPPYLVPVIALRQTPGSVGGLRMFDSCQGLSSSLGTCEEDTDSIMKVRSALLFAFANRPL